MYIVFQFGYFYIKFWVAASSRLVYWKTCWLDLCLLTTSSLVSYVACVHIMSYFIISIQIFFLLFCSFLLDSSFLFWWCLFIALIVRWMSIFLVCLEFTKFAVSGSSYSDIYMITFSVLFSAFLSMFLCAFFSIFVDLICNSMHSLLASTFYLMRASTGFVSLFSLFRFYTKVLVYKLCSLFLVSVFCD